MFINIYVWYVGLKEIYMSNTYSLKKTNFSAKMKSILFFNLSYLLFLSEVVFNFFKLDEV